MRKYPLGKTTLEITYRFRATPCEEASMLMHNHIQHNQNEIAVLENTIEEIKGLSPVKIEETKIPRYSHRLNPNIDRNEIKEAKKLVRSLNKK